VSEESDTEAAQASFETALRTFLADLPAPPALWPQGPPGNLTADTVLDVAQALARGQSFRSAATRARINTSLLDYRRRSEGGDPFYAWACACWDLATAFMTALLEERNLAIALGREAASPSSAKATEAMLGRLSDTYAPAVQAPTGMSAQELHANVLVLLQGGANNPAGPFSGGLGALINGAFPAPTKALETPAIEAPYEIEEPPASAPHKAAAPANPGAPLPSASAPPAPQKVSFRKAPGGRG